MFTDLVKLKISAGKGGDGVIAWRREKFIAKGGPEGGDGGDGGSVIFVANENLFGLEALRNAIHLSAQNGEPGGGSGCYGKKGQDLRIEVPMGTIFKDRATGAVLMELLTHGQTWIAAKGGRRGKGNIHFKTATRQAPYICTKGLPGESLELELELRLLADVALVGFPNAGKSTFFSALTRARAKVGAYPFTTLFPNLGLLRFEDYTYLKIADVPGIIENAHLGKGLGFEFLRHVERSSILLFVVDTFPESGPSPAEAYATLRAELEAYNPSLLERPQLLLLSKVDLDEQVEPAHAIAKEMKLECDEYLLVSAGMGKGIEEVKKALFQLKIRFEEKSKAAKLSESLILG